jgi:hypothetical protein
MRLNDGEEKLLPRLAVNERNERHAEWKRMKRPLADICGKNSRHWRKK